MQKLPGSQNQGRRLPNPQFVFTLLVQGIEWKLMNPHNSSSTQLANSYATQSSETDIHQTVPSLPCGPKGVGQGVSC